MTNTLALRPQAIESYRPFIGDGAMDEILQLAAPLRGLRVLHLSVTAFGTTVAEMLNSSVPLISDMGLDCHWQVVRSAEASAAANKALYRALAGAPSDWTPEMVQVWLAYNEMNAELLAEPYDVIIVHDPQPAAIRAFAPPEQSACWVLHSHLDLSSARPDAWELIAGHVDSYDALVFDTEAFIHPDLAGAANVRTIRPAIDPLGPRNMELSDEAVRTILGQSGIDPERPLLTQMAPCDPGSDLMGMIEVHERLRREVPGLQLALIASSPPEDAPSIAYFNDVVARASDYEDVHIVRGVSEVGNVELNAFQRASNVVAQKGLRKGFGIWISDAQWKECPVVSSSTGGLAQQVIHGETGFLTDDTDTFAGYVSQLLTDTALAQRFGEAGRRHVSQNFLLTRLVTDELRLLAELTGRAP